MGTHQHHIQPVLSVEHLSTTFTENGVQLPVLRDISFAMMGGEFLAFIGPSGSGKTTLLDIIAGLLDPDAGVISISGHETRATERLGRCAYMHQRDLLLPWRRAIENAALGLEVQGMSKSLSQRQVGARFDEFGLSGFENHYPAQLSGGMRQRVAFLRTLATGQPLLLLDEPFGALDAMTRATSQHWLQSVLQRLPRTVVLVTHDVEEAIFLADRVLVLTPRPGHVSHIEVVTEPRPRSRSFVTTSSFAGHKRGLLAELGLLDQVALT